MKLPLCCFHHHDHHHRLLPTVKGLSFSVCPSLSLCVFSSFSSCWFCCPQTSSCGTKWCNLSLSAAHPPPCSNSFLPSFLLSFSFIDVKQSSFFFWGSSSSSPPLGLNLSSQIPWTKDSFSCCCSYVDSRVHSSEWTPSDEFKTHSLFIWLNSYRKKKEKKGRRRSPPSSFLPFLFLLDDKLGCIGKERRNAFSWYNPHYN